MNKVVISTICIVVFLFGAWIVIRLTHVVDFYTVPSVSSAPTYRPGNLLIASILNKPEGNKFICFRKEGNKSIWFSRCVANDEKNYHLKLNPVIEPKGKVDSQLFVGFSAMKSNRDNFGPLKIPGDNYFVLGDNRHDAYDSRYIGLIKKDEVVSTVFR